MKTIAIISIILFVISTNLRAQDLNRNNLDQQTGYWKLTESQGFYQNNNSPEVFTWQMVQTPVSYQIIKVFFADSLHGWAGHNGNGGLRTTDSGFNWSIISFNDTNFSTLYNGVYFLNQYTGWIVGGSVQIRKTTNGGVNWFKQNSSPVAGVLNSIYFWDTSNGIAIGRKNINYNSFIEKTTNAGSNWFEIVATTANENELHDQYWFDANTGWISGRNTLLYSTNSGLNYTNLYSNIPPTSNGQNELLSIIFVNQQTGWIGGSNLDHQNLYITSNAGSNWTFQSNPASNYTYPQINDVAFMTPDSGWAIHGTPASGAIMFTTNRGTNWEIENGNNYWFNTISIYQRSKAWVGASGGSVWYTILTPPTGIVRTNEKIPNFFKLYQNYPNPFNPETKIRFDVPSVRAYRNTPLQINVFDILGREVTTLVNEQLKPGSYEITWNASNYSSGVYFYRITSGEFSDTKKMVLVR